MKKLIGFVGLLLLIGCWKDDEQWRERLNGTAGNNPTISAVGCIEADYPDWQTSEYYLPYPIGEAYPIGLGHCDGSYHSEGLPDQFAIDFNMTIGQRVLASRGGRVISIEESGIDGGFPNNYVLIQHSDNTFGWYMHLTNNGAVVEVGDRVGRGTLIGYSGSTGLAGYPHLHLVFTYGNRWPYQSFPVTFKNTLANERSLESGQVYPAFPN